MMRGLDFCEGWVTLIMRCVQSVFYSVLLNKGQEAVFKPTIGLKQGDPLSPYLFINYTEGFSRLLSHAMRDGKIGGILFGKASLEGALAMKTIIKDYENMSGQLVNFDKSLIYFSNITSEEDQTRIGGELGVKISNNPEKYLGLPTMVVDLINDENHTWKEDIIEDLFTEEPTKKTLTIPLVNSSFPDKLVWRGDSTEEYSVKSGYKWCITSNQNGTRQTIIYKT
ncbi:hypothetical protein Goklo_000114 [Gossypium klotzschianum]|uniref:Reverse transcriptase domain-containing protein n=1 Tax=Gossypium klotzschianum TaxID=34286 RepID=A0A7J8WC01_9ROSI|nr:hypothetical protein [Gossypium klotzschianum]